MPSISHSVPHNAVPILESPYRVGDFFSDYDPELDENSQKQFSGSVKCYPPPKAPFLASEESVSRPGVMVPFVFPPIPAIQYDPLTNMPDASEDIPEDEDSKQFYPVMAPLPFPPPNYMPYPLISEKAPPTPHEVFGKWLDASEHLPRVDMVVASAAGSIFDLHTEAGASGIGATKLQEMVRLGQLAESDPEASDDKSDSSDSSDVSESSYRNFMEYYEEQAQNDEQLLSLKLSSNYEKLKTVLNFYQTSSRSYKTMNSVMINKLQKMKNFLEYQKSVFDDHSSPRGSNDVEVMSIRNRDISKLYESFVDQDYSNEIKESFRAAIAKDDDVEKEDPYVLEPSLFRKVYTGHEHHAIVHDFMPLVTREEFKLVTGEAPSKLGPAKDLVSKGKSGRHQIFQSSLYDRVTSGSDTNASDSGTQMKRRPGRRAAPKPTYGEEVAKHNNDSALVAKIMKQFIGPGAANAQELTEDLNLIGIETKWPVK
ncbi:hypothetical protein JCM33374_g6323 [Metschnikowia sp. JCM 33374]|nr:hypothetical protein JCM33374_g6323 [Metschnikowia sp. JCM 33374]